MEQTRQVVFRVFHGPNVITPFAAVSAQFAVPFANTLHASAVKQATAALLHDEFAANLIFESDAVDFTTLVASAASAMQNLKRQNDFSQQIDRLDDGSTRISIGFHDSDVAVGALRCGLDLAAAVFTRNAGGVVNTVRLKTIYNRAVNLSTMHQPEKNSWHLIRVAKTRDIPVFTFSAGSRAWMYGYGARGVRFWKAVVQSESLVGSTIASDKVWTQRLLQRAGFPAVPFGIAEDARSAREIARQIGYPVVTKPTDTSGGRGVVVGIRNEEELDTAFAKSQSLALSKAVLIEKFISGDHCRLTLFGGKLRRAALFKPAQVVADGRSTLAELVKIENAKRAAEDSPAQEVGQIPVNSTLVTLLAKQGTHLEDRPPEGKIIFLRETSNVATGGRIFDVSDQIHPDNVELAEAVARVIGIRGMAMDLITPDITKSWRETDCAIIDVNCPAGVTSDALASKALAEAIPLGENGRIPCILVLGGPSIFESVIARLEAAGKKVGRVDSATSIAGRSRFATQPGWPARIMALLLDPACEVLVTLATARDVEDFGLPHVRFNLALVADQASLSPDVAGLLERHVDNVVACETGADLETKLESSISDLLST